MGLKNESGNCCDANNMCMTMIFLRKITIYQKHKGTLTNIQNGPYRLTSSKVESQSFMRSGTIRQSNLRDNHKA